MRNVPASPSGRHEKTSGAARSSSRELRSLPSLCGSGSFHTKTSSLLDRFYQGKTIPMCSKQVTVTAATAFAFALAFGLPWDLVEETGFFLGFLGAVAFSVETSCSIHSASSSSLVLVHEKLCKRPSQLGCRCHCFVLGDGDDSRLGLGVLLRENSPEARRRSRHLCRPGSWRLGDLGFVRALGLLPVICRCWGFVLLVQAACCR